MISILLWGISCEEIFKNIIRLMHFGVYYERNLTIQWLFLHKNKYITDTRIC